MRIKRIEVIGFKSFCDRAVVNIGESVTGVVGPNGCGKSNIVDAIRWCMGEQSAKHLRGKAMEDVIFAGSESRGPAPMAEVSLTFDDVGFSHEALELARHSDVAEAERAMEGIGGEGLAEAAPDAQVVVTEAVADDAKSKGVWTDAEGNPIPSPLDETNELLADRPASIDFARYTEVTITRRLYRDGASDYFINKSACRLRDITDFFLGTGIGTKAYAIIEQGRVGQIVSARPQDRRAIIEEAAGITKFKTKKKAAEKKLDQTRQNLMRVSDIVTELDKRMGTLRRQAQKAERYRKYKTELRDIELWKGAHRWLELNGEGQLLTARLTTVRAELEDARTAFDAKDAHVVAERAELAIEERRLVGLQEQVYEHDNRIRLGESKLGFEGREADELETRVAVAGTEIEDIAAQRARGAEELTAREAELAELAADVERESMEVATREAATGEARQMLANAQGRLDEARAEIAARRTEIATAEAQREALARRRDEAQRRLERVLGETEQHAERVRELEREGRRVDGALVELRQTRLDLGSQHQDFEARHATLSDEVARGEAEVETLRSETQRRSSRLASLKEIQDRYEGFARGTRAVMMGASDPASGLADDADAIRGLVADIVRAPEQLEIAVEAALGDRLGGILVREPDVGLAAIGFLKTGGGGRSAFVPMSLKDVAPAEPVSGDGVLGRMADLVAFADGYEAVGRRLFGATIVVDGLARALELHRGGAADRIVTLDGDVVEHDGVVAGGSRDAQGAGVLAQKREIRDLEELVGRLEHDLSEAMTKLVTAKAELKQVGKAIEGLRTQQHESALAIMGHEKDESRVRGELERGRDRLGHLGTEQLELEERLGTIGNDEHKYIAAKQTAEERIAVRERDQLDFISEVAGHRDRLEELGQLLTEVRIRAAQLGEKRAAAEATALRLQRADGELATRAKRLAHEIEDATRRAGELRADCAAIAAELETVRVVREQEASELDLGRTAYHQRMSGLTEVELAARELRSRVDTLGREGGQLDLRAGQNAINRQVVEDHIAERYQLALITILHDYHLRAPVDGVAEARLVELRDLIDRMGTDINLTAIDEFAEVNQRFEFLSAQKNDLERAVDQLQKAIDKINKTSRKLFKDTFTAVNAKFKEIFPRLFRGGQAALSLAGGDDVDLLEAGIDIMAQPPGKKNSSVDQLSGGEKALTAVALVFSIFLIKPSPFCILDEVDAPLDEANVDRYNEMVREMTDRSQFIVITHNKRTMESADSLYGVTMQEPGVSKLVSVNLSKIARGVAANGAGSRGEVTAQA